MARRMQSAASCVCVKCGYDEREYQIDEWLSRIRRELEPPESSTVERPVEVDGAKIQRIYSQKRLPSTDADVDRRQPGRSAVDEEKYPSVATWMAYGICPEKHSCGAR